MRKAIMVVLTASVLILMFVPSVFANSNSMFTVGSVYVRSSTDLEWYPTTNFSWSPSSATTTLLVWKPPEAPGVPHGLRFTLVPYGYVQVQSGYYYNFTFSFSGKVNSSSSLEDYDPLFSLTFRLSDGTVKTISPYSTDLRTVPDETKLTWESRFALYVGDGVPVRVEGITFETAYWGDTNSSYHIYVDSSVTPEPTPELQRHLEMMQKLQEIFTGLKDEIAAQTEAILGESYDYSDPSDKGSSDASIADLAEQLAGLSDQINQSVSDFRSSIDGLTDHINAGKAFIWGWLDYVPVWFTGIVTGFAGLLIARKIVK